MTRERCIEILGWLKTPVDYDEVVTLINKAYDDFEEDKYHRGKGGYTMLDGDCKTTTIKPKQPQYSFKLVDEYTLKSDKVFEQEVEKYLNDGYKLYGNIMKSTGGGGNLSVCMLKEF